eukprot:1094055-Pelagomonas_calceolata.AAC.1
MGYLERGVVTLPGPEAWLVFEGGILQLQPAPPRRRSSNGSMSVGHAFTPKLSKTFLTKCEELACCTQASNWQWCWCIWETHRGPIEWYQHGSQRLEDTMHYKNKEDGVLYLGGLLGHNYDVCSCQHAISTQKALALNLKRATFLWADDSPECKCSCPGTIKGALCTASGCSEKKKKKKEKEKSTQATGRVHSGKSLN